MKLNGAQVVIESLKNEKVDVVFGYPGGVILPLYDEMYKAEYKKRLIDRFGPLPEQAEELTNVVRLRWLCCEMGIEKIYLKGERMTLYFVTNNEHYWQSEMFGKIILYAAQRPERCKLVEDRDKKGQPTGKRYMTVMQVKTLAGALNLLHKICN